MKKLFLSLLFAVSLSAQILHQATVNLTDAQIKALPTTAVEILPASSGIIYIPTLATWYEHWVSDYSNIAANAAINVNNSGYSFLTALFESPSSQITSLLANGDDYFEFTGPLSNLGSSYLYGLDYFPSSVIGRALVVSGYNGFNGTFTGGDPSNRLTITVAYLILNTTTGQFE